MASQCFTQRQKIKAAGCPPTFRGEQIKFIIGRERTEFHVYKSFVCYHSRIFERALNGNFVEAISQTYIIPDIKPEVFEKFVQWLYQPADSDPKTLSLESEQLRKTPDVHEAPSEKRQEYVRNVGLLQELWKFGDKYEMPQLQNTCLNHHEILQIKYGLILFPLEHSFMTNKYEDFVIDTCAFYCGNGVSWREGMLETASKDVLVKVIAAMGSVKGKPEAKDYFIDVSTDEQC